MTAAARRHAYRSTTPRRARGVALLAATATVAALAFAGTDSAAAPASGAAALTATQARALAAGSTHKVIVILKSQPKSQRVGSAAAARRAAAVKAAQRPLLTELGKVHAGRVRSYQTVNSVAAVVSSGEVARLRANPNVAKVIPDSTIKLAAPAAAGAASPAAGGALTPHVIPGACGKNGAVQLEPEGLTTTHTDSDDPNETTARSLGYDGAGVKVAYLAEGIDPNNVDFLRADGTSAFSDYQDFSGDGPNSPSAGGEAFLDASAIGAQGLVVHNVAHFAAQKYPQRCNIRLEGTAPGASIVGLKVFSNGITTTSNFLQAINYAVQVDHVNVLNESFGGNPFPDTAADATKLFNDAAVAAGVAVTVSTGDAGPFNTQGSPSTDPNVISAAGSTDLRWLAQTNYELARDVATTGWLSNNISALSSSGYDSNARVPDITAPADSSFAACDASPKFADCVDFLNRPAAVERSGGTSQSAPFLAGVAALVIQAYRAGHAGASPTPAQIKQILTSTADDLGAPATEQGSGQVDSLRAVQLAKSMGTPAADGATVALSAGQLTAVDQPGTGVALPLTVTNTGSSSRTVRLSGRRLGPDQHVQRGTVTLDDASSPQTPDWMGTPSNYSLVHFTVAPGQDRLDASLAYPGDPAKGNNARVRFSIVDPDGRFAGHSLPQGVGNYGEFDVQHPTAGTWTGIIFSKVASAGGTNGKIHWRVATQQYRSFGSITPSLLTLAAGQSSTVTVHATTPATPGDASGSVVVSTASTGSDNPATTVSVSLRSMIDPTSGGVFRGTLTGGNGRPPGQGQEQYYQFQVGAGVNDITADVVFPHDPADPVAEYLVSPDGDVLGYGQNQLGTSSYNVLTAYTLHPVAGTWTLIVDFAAPVTGKRISQPYVGDVVFDRTRATATGLPNDPATKLKAGKRVSVPVTITNTGVAPEAYYLDARLDTVQTVQLAPLSPNSGSLPLTTSEPYWFVPTQTTGLAMQATGSKPIMFDYQPDSGDPDISSATAGPGSLCSSNPSSAYTPPGGSVTSGIWFGIPSQCGPYTDAGAPAATFSMTASATTKAFDPAVTSRTGDAELIAVDPNAKLAPVVLGPGQSATVNVKIVPSGPPGTVVSGTIYVDDLSNNVPPYGQLAGSEVAGLPYTYTIR